MKKIIAVALFTLFAAPAFAESTGFYGALDVNTWTLSNKGTGVENPSAGIRVAGGYHFTPNWGAEIGYTESGNGTTSIPADYKITSAQMAVTGTYPVNEQFDLFAKLGYAANKMTGAATAGCPDCSKNDFLYGFGAQFNFNKQFGVRLQYEDIGKVADSIMAGQTDQPKAANISLGVVYNF